MEVRWTSMPPNGRAADRRAPGAYARRVRRAPGRREARREPRVFCAAKRPGRVSFVDFFARTKKSTPGCRGGSHPRFFIVFAAGDPEN
jgi:hypothetical protein